MPLKKFHKKFISAFEATSVAFLICIFFQDISPLWVEGFEGEIILNSGNN